MKMIYPHSLNILLKRLKNIISTHEDCERAVHVIDEIMCRPFDTVYFSRDVIERTMDKLEFAQLLLHMETPVSALSSLADIRMDLDKIFIRELLFTNRLSQTDSDIGSLNMLPDLIKFELYKDIYGSL